MSSHKHIELEIADRMMEMADLFDKHPTAKVDIRAWKRLLLYHPLRYDISTKPEFKQEYMCQFHEDE